MEWDLTAGIGRDDFTHGGNRTGPVRAVDEEEPGITGLPGFLDEAIEDQPCGDLFDGLHRAGVDQGVEPVLLDRGHELVASGHADVEVPDLAVVRLAPHEVQDIGVLDMENPHVRAPAGSALAYLFGGAVNDLHEGDRA